MLRKLIATVAVVLMLSSNARLLASRRAGQSAFAYESTPQEGRSQTPDTPPAEQPCRVGGKLSPPRLIHSVDPKFSKDGRKYRLSGKSIVELTIDTNGVPQNVRVERSIAEDLSQKNQKYAGGMDAKAVEAVAQYRFSPAICEGKPAPSLIHVEVFFHIY